MVKEHDIQFKLRLPAKLRAQLESAAEQSGRSIGAEMVQRIGDSFDSTNEVEQLRAHLDTLARAIEANAKAHTQTLEHNHVLIEIIRVLTGDGSPVPKHLRDQAQSLATDAETLNARMSTAMDVVSAEAEGTRESLRELRDAPTAPAHPSPSRRGRAKGGRSASGS